MLNVLIGPSGTRVKKIIEIDLPRPRDIAMLGSKTLPGAQALRVTVSARVREPAII